MKVKHKNVSKKVVGAFTTFPSYQDIAENMLSTWENGKKGRRRKEKEGGKGGVEKEKNERIKMADERKRDRKEKKRVDLLIRRQYANKCKFLLCRFDY